MSREAHAGFCERRRVKLPPPTLHLLGFTGPKAEAEHIKDQLAAFLRDELKLELSAEKTLITHARTRAARYLGYEIITQHSDHKITRGHRSINGSIALHVPPDVIKAKCAPYLQHGKPEARTAMHNLDDHDIVATYGAEYRGIVQYYLLATDVWRLARLRWTAETSMLKTLAAKHQSTVSKIAAKHKATIETPHGSRTCFEARIERTGKQPLVARFGGIPLARKKDAILNDHVPKPVPCPHKELIIRLRRGRCELCQEPGKVQVHQIRTLAQLGQPGTGQPHGRPSWPRNGARPWWSASPATRSSTTGHPPHQRHKSLESLVHRKSAPSNSALDRPRRGQRFGRR